MNNPNKFPPHYNLHEAERPSRRPSLRLGHNSLPPFPIHPILARVGSIGQPQLIYPPLVNNVGMPNYNLGWSALNNMGSVGQPGSIHPSFYSSATSRGTIEQQGAANIMSTASIIPKKMQQSIRRANEQQDQSMLQHQSSRQPHAQNILHHYLQHQQQLRHIQNNSVVTLPNDEGVPLRKWTEKEPCGDFQPDNVQKQTGMMLRRTAIAYAMIELIRGARTSAHASTCYELQQACNIDNFLVLVTKAEEEESKIDGLDDQGFAGKIKGVQMINPPSSLVFAKPFVSSGERLSEEDGDEMGQFIEVEVFPSPLAYQAINPLEKLLREQSLIHSVGSLIHELYTLGNPILLLYEFQKGGGASPSDDSGADEPPLKKIKENPHQEMGRSKSLPPWERYDATPMMEAASASTSVGDRKSRHLSLLELGFSSSLSSLVDELLDCKCTLEVASKDLQLILLDPSSFLTDRYFKAQPDGKVSLRIRKNQLYGRDSESSLIASTFRRVRTSGKSEALLIGGISGSGKSFLIQSVLKKMIGVSCHVVSHTSDESSSSVITQALNQLCVSIQESCSEEERLSISSRLTEAFGSDFSILEKVLPNSKNLFNDPNRAKPISPKHHDSEIQSNSVSYILRLFMRAVSSKEKPVVLFIDDLQWCDDASLDIVHDILSDAKGSPCVYFLGCFRDDEVDSDHSIFQFIKNMNMNDVPAQLLGLSGLNRNELNCLTSDALCILPRHCKDLSDIIHLKTKGDPYFTLEMLNALVGRGLLQFEFPKRRWTWNQASITYLDVTSNVLHLLKSQLMSMPKQMQTALKVCSCFGIGIGPLLVRYLSDSVEYRTLRDELEHAIDEGFVEKVGGGYKFVHDRVKEAAYDLIREQDRKGFHYQVGMILLSSSNVDNSLIPIIADQINHGLHEESIHSKDDNDKIAELNYNAGSITMAHSGFVKAFSYFQTAKSLLHKDHWNSQYYFSIRLFLSSSNAAFACGHVNLAEQALDAILIEGKCLEDKLDAYYFKSNLLFHRGQAKEAYDRCAEVLCGLGETIPTEVDSKEFNDVLQNVLNFVTSMSDDELLRYNECGSRLHFYLMQFYQQLSWFSFFGQSSSMQSYLWCRSVEIAIRSGFCKYTAASMASVACLLCGKFKDKSNGYRLGRIALSLLTRFNATGLIPIVYLGVYGMVAFNSEPVMHCADQLHRGFQLGMSLGQPTIALMNGLHFIQKSFVGGRNLVALSKEIDYQLELCEKHDDSRAKRFMGLFKETLCQIIDKNQAKTDTTTLSEGAGALDEAMKIEGFSEVVFSHRIIQSYWLGYADRCHFFAQKSVGEAVVGRLMKLVASFYHGLAALQILRRKKSKVEMKDIARTALKDLASASDLAPINFKNKAELLEAELHRTEVVLRGNEEERMHAKKMYAKSVCSAESANLNHEQALALELAGHFYEENGELANALRNFREAKLQYALWGSTVRVTQMEVAIARTETRLAR